MTLTAWGRVSFSPSESCPGMGPKVLGTAIWAQEAYWEVLLRSTPAGREGSRTGGGEDRTFEEAVGRSASACGCPRMAWALPRVEQHVTHMGISSGHKALFSWCPYS